MSSKNTRSSSTRQIHNKADASVPGFSFVKNVKDFHEYVLKKNGLRVLYMQVPGVGSVTVNVVYSVGSRHEERGKTGLAHMLEHMMFKPTKDRKGRISRPPRYVALQNQGALLNASTWNDRTNYYFSMPSAYLGEILKAEAERMRGLLIEEGEFTPERQNVLSEFDMYADRPAMALESAILNSAFVSHGYGHDTIGFRSDIAGSTVKDLKDFYDVYYWPDNAHLVIVGDVPLATALLEVKKHFSHIPKAPHAFPHGSYEEPAQDGLRTVEVVKKNPLSMVMVTYKAPPGRDQRWVHAQLLLAHLAEGKLGTLYKKLVETRMASSVSPFIYPTRDSYIMGITAMVNKGIAPEKVRDVITKEMATTAGKGVSVPVLQRLKERSLASSLYERDGTHSIAREMTEHIAMGAWERYYSTLDDIRSATATDLARIADEYLKPKQCIIGIFRGTSV